MGHTLSAANRASRGMVCNWLAVSKCSVVPEAGRNELRFSEVPALRMNDGLSYPGESPQAV